jgi:Icc-related predicted phosphoesterase
MYDQRDNASTAYSGINQRPPTELLAKLMALFGRSKDREKRIRLYYASDVHGSDLCWRKFLNAAKHYEAGTLIMGGDLTGKALVPILRQNGGYSAWVIGEERHASAPEELADLESAIRMNGFYPLHATPEQHQAMRDHAGVREELFLKAMIDELRRWVELADERRASTGVDIFVMPGNDDPWAIDPVLEESGAVVACDGRIVHVGKHEMISCGYSNPTPWNSPRELDEEELYRKIHGLAEQLESPQTAIFNLHAPPHDSGLDTAMELDDELRPVMQSGRTHEIPVGSTAVRQLIEEFQPLLALHGHIHESRGVTHIGRTVAINPGSDYSGGRIDGCIVDLSDSGVKNFQLVSG